MPKVAQPLTDTQVRATQPIEGKAHPPSHPYKNLRRCVTHALAIISMVSLCVTNYLSLTNDAFHARAYSLLEGVFDSTLVGNSQQRSLSQSLLKHSPTMMRRQDTAIATHALHQRNQALTVKTARLTEEKLQLDKDKHRLTADFHRLSTKHDNLLNEKKLLVETNNRNVAAAKKLSARAVNRAVHGATRNVASLGGEAIPMIGVTVAVAAAAFDVKDACDVLKDVNEMHNVLGAGSVNALTVCGMRVPSREEVWSSVQSNWQASYEQAAAFLQAGSNAIPRAAPNLSWSPILERFDRMFSRDPK